MFTQDSQILLFSIRGPEVNNLRSGVSARRSPDCWYVGPLRSHPSPLLFSPLLARGSIAHCFLACDGG